MTLKYESELLFELMKRDGDGAPSDVLPYESELKEKYLEQVEGAYPKLQDYRPEWLYYNLYYHIPSDFPVESVANVTSAIFYDVVPYAYKSAILKGCTLVNLQPKSQRKSWGIDLNGDIPANNSYGGFDGVLPKLKPSTKYLIKFSKNISEKYNSTYFSQATVTVGNIVNDYRIVTTLDSLTADTTPIHIYTINNAFSTTGEMYDYLSDLHVMVIEYQDGMENWDIPYFEGMQSAKMPVLTTSNEDGTKTNILTVNEPVELRGIGEVKDTLDCLTGEVTERIGEIVFDGSEDWNSWGSRVAEGMCGIYTKTNLENMAPGEAESTIICDTLPNSLRSDLSNTTYDSVIKGRDYIGIIMANKTEKEIMAYLKSKPITVQYPLKEKVVKTVDLSCINEQGKSATFRPIEGTMHVNTSSQALTPLLDMSVPVEATTQNLMSFANIEEED